MKIEKPIKLTGLTGRKISHFGIENNTGVNKTWLNKDLFVLHGATKDRFSEVLGVFNDLKKAREVAKDFLDIPAKSLPKIKKDILDGDFDIHTTRGVRGVLAFAHKSAWVEFVNVNEKIDLG